MTARRYNWRDWSPVPRPEKPSIVKRKYRDWLLDIRPAGQDGKLTRQALANALGVSVERLDNLDRDETFVAATTREMLKYRVITPDRCAVILEHVVQAALGGDLRACYTVLRWIGRAPVWDGRTTEQIVREVPKADEMREMSDDELAALLDELRDGRHNGNRG